MPRKLPGKTRTRKYGTNPQRTARARKALVDAAVSLIADRGPREFIIAEVERLAGLKRGVAAYHFQGSSSLLDTVLAQLVAAEALPTERGIQPLLSWMDQKLAALAARDPEVRATMQVVTAAGAGADIRRAQRLYWKRRTAFVEAHLVRAQILGEVRAGLDPTSTAEILLGQLHGEQLRIVTTNAKASSLFGEILRRGLAPEPSKPKPRKAKATGTQQNLFGTDQ